MNIQPRMVRLLSEATEQSWHTFMLKAEEQFLNEVARVLQKSVGSRIKFKVTGTSMKMLLAKGTNRSDLEVDFSLVIENFSTSPDLVEVQVEGTDPEGKVQEVYRFKRGELTPQKAADAYLQWLN